MKSIKKITVFTLCALSALSLVACKKKTTTKSSTTTNVVTTAKANTTAKKNTTTQAKTTTKAVDGQVSKEAWVNAFNYYFNLDNRNFTLDIVEKLPDSTNNYNTRVVNDKSVIKGKVGSLNIESYTINMLGAAVETFSMGYRLQEVETTLSYESYLGNYKKFAELYSSATFDSTKGSYKFNYDAKEYEVEFNSNLTIKRVAMITDNGFVHTFSNYGTTKIDDYKEIDVIKPTKNSTPTTPSIDYFQYDGTFTNNDYVLALDLSLAPNIIYEGVKPIIILQDSAHTSHIKNAQIILNGKELSSTNYNIESNVIYFSDSLKLTSNDKLMILFRTDLTEETSCTIIVSAPMF